MKHWHNHTGKKEKKKVDELPLASVFMKYTQENLGDINRSLVSSKMQSLVPVALYPLLGVIPTETGLSGPHQRSVIKQWC